MWYTISNLLCIMLHLARLKPYNGNDILYLRKRKTLVAYSRDIRQKRGKSYEKES